MLFIIKFANQIMSKSQITFVYQSGRKDRLNSKGAFPQEFFYGFEYFKNVFDKYKIIEFNNKEFKNMRSQISQFLEKISGLPFFMQKIINLENYKIFKNSDVIVFTNQRVAISTLPIVKYLNLYKNNKKIVYVMGLFNVVHKNNIKNFLRRFFIGVFVKNFDHLIFLSKGEYEFVKNNYSKFSSKFSFIPFSVDTTFWKDKNEKRKNNRILFIGNDGKRDYDFAIDLANKLRDFEFIFVTNKIQQSPDLPPNITLHNGSWHENLLTDSDIRNLYNSSCLTIIPLKESLQPSGQSVALQSMSCGTPVMITKTKGFWEIEKFEDQKNIFFISKNEVSIWAPNIINFFQNYKNDENLKKNIIQTIEENYSLDRFNSEIEKIIFNY